MLFPAILAGNVPYNVLWLMSEHIQPASPWSCQDTLPRLQWVLKCGKGRPGKQEPEALCLFPIPEAAAFPAGWPQPCQGELGSCTPSPGALSQGSCPVQTAQSKALPGISREGFTSQAWHSPSSWALFPLPWSNLIHNLQLVP